MNYMYKQQKEGEIVTLKSNPFDPRPKIIQISAGVSSATSVQFFKKTSHDQKSKLSTL